MVLFAVAVISFMMFISLNVCEGFTFQQKNNVIKALISSNQNIMEKKTNSRSISTSLPTTPLSILKIAIETKTNSRLLSSYSPASFVSKIIIVVSTLLFILHPTIAIAIADVATVIQPIDVFSDPKVLNQAFQGAIGAVFWIVPYAIFNLIIAPKIGLIDNEIKTKEKKEEKSKDIF